MEIIYDIHVMVTKLRLHLSLAYRLRQQFKDFLFMTSTSSAFVGHEAGSGGRKGEGATCGV
jgi:hypothetical protein